MRDPNHQAKTHAAESGQAAVSLLLMLSLFLLGTLALAVDFTNMWFHRQAEQAAADAACEAGSMDLLATAVGLPLPAMGFKPGTASNCVSSSSATMCSYANANGYSGSGLASGSASNSVSWTFPAAVTGITPPPAAQAPHPFLSVTISENVRTFFVSLLNLSQFQQVNVSSTCGLVDVKSIPPMLILHPTMSGSLTYNGGSAITIVGGPSRGLQVNSTSMTAVNWAASGRIDLSAGGANQTGSDMAVVGGPAVAPSNGSSSAYDGGSTGTWKSRVLPVADPFGTVASPASIKSIKPVNTTSGAWVAYGVDGCPDHSGSHSPATHACMEFSPGYYPAGLKLPDNYTTAIFLPGIYYLNGSLTASGTNTLRMAKPPSHVQTDGIMLYFLTGSINISGCSGCASSSVDPASSADLTCDGSLPAAALGVPSALTGNVLIAQCAASGTYWDTGGDTSDSRSPTGVRGLLIFQDHGNKTPPQLTGSGSLIASGSLYLHSTSYADVLTINGGSGSYYLGEMVLDQLNLSGSGSIKLGLNRVASSHTLKAALLR